MSIGEIALRKGRVERVDRKHWTCDLTLDEGGFIEDVPIAPIYSGPQNSGMFYVPERDSIVYVATFGDGRAPFIIATAPPMATELRDDENDDPNSPNWDEIPDFRMGRDVCEEGDMILRGADGSFVIVRSNGVVEIGANQLARRYYIPLNQVIRDLARNYQVITPGGQLEFIADESDDRHGTKETSVVTDATSGETEIKNIPNYPTTFKLNVKELALDQDPVVKIQMGMVNSSDGDEPLPNSRSVDWRDIVFEMEIEELDPTQPNNARAIGIWMDKKGSMTATFMGSTTTTVHEDAYSYVLGSRENHTGKEDWLSCLNRTRIVTGNDTLTVHGNAVRRFLGDLDIDLRGKITTSGSFEGITGGVEWKPTKYDLNISGSGRIEAEGGDLVLKGFQGITMGASSGGCTETWAKIKKIDCTLAMSNIPPPIPPKTPETRSFYLRSRKGIAMIESKPTSLTGLIPYMSGIQFKTAMARVVITDQGSVYIRGGSPSIGGPYFEISPSTPAEGAPGAGGIAMSNGKGVGIWIEDNVPGVAQIALGAPLGAAHGNVVTTLTHPVCYVTGLPILGSSVVTALSAPPLPGPSRPNTMITKAAAVEAAVKADDINFVKNHPEHLV